MITEVKIEDTGFSYMRIVVSSRAVDKKFSKPSVEICLKAGPSTIIWTDYEELGRVRDLIEKVEGMVLDLGGRFE